MRLISKTLFSLFMFLPLAAHAEKSERGFYGVVSAGPTEIEYTATAKLSGNGYGIGVGYEFSKYIAVEAMYLNLFSFKETFNNRTFTYDITGYGVRGILKYPLNDSFIPILSIGSVSASETVTSGNSSYRSSGSLTAFGLGAEIPLDGKIVIRVLIESADNKNIQGSTIAHIGLMSRF